MSLQISTSTIDAGYVSGRAEYEVSITNSGGSAVTINEIDVPSFRSGLAIAGPQAPATVAAGQSVIYTLIVRRSGEAKFSGRWTFRTATQALSVTVSGERVVLWPFKHNWKSDFRIRRDWATDVFTAPSGQEKRVAKRHQPRHTISFTSLPRKSDFPRARALLSGAKAAPLVFADPTRRVLTTGAGLGSALPVGEGVDWCREGSWVVIAGEEVARIAAYSSGSAVFERSLSRTWPEGTQVQPAWRGEWNADASGRARSDSVLEMSVELRAFPGDAAPEPTGMAEPLFNGKEVYPLPHNWTSDLSLDGEWVLDTIDPGFGPWFSEATQLYGRTVSKISLLLKNRDVVARHEAFFNRMRGQQGSFYKSTGLSDFMLVPGAEKHSTRWIRAIGTEAFRFLQDFETTRAIEVRGVSGPERYQITSIAQDGAHTLIQLDRDPDTDPATWVQISWLQLCRFATDTLIIDYKTDALATTTAAFITIEDE